MAMAMGTCRCRPEAERHSAAAATGAVAIGAVATGAAVIGAVAIGAAVIGAVAIGAAVTNSSLPVDLVCRSSTGIPLTGTIRTAITAIKATATATTKGTATTATTKGTATTATTKGTATATTKGTATTATTKGTVTATATKGIATATATKGIATANNGRSKKGKYVSEADAIKQGDRPAPGFTIAKKSLSKLRLALLHVASQTTKAFSHCYTSLESLLKAKWQRIRPPAPPRISTHVYEIRPRGDHRGIDLIFVALPFGRLWYGDPDAITTAIE